jgi:hypothetical protein
MSADFKPSYLSGVLRAGARPFVASAHARPRKSAPVFPATPASVAAHPDAEGFETQRPNVPAPSHADERTPTPSAQRQASAPTRRDAPAGHVSERADAKELRREPARPHPPDDSDAQPRPQLHNARRVHAPAARPHVENFPPRENDARSNSASNEAAPRTTPDARPAHEPRDESPRLHIEPPPVNSGDEATAKSPAPRVRLPEAAPAQASAHTLEAHIAQLRARMQAPREERADARDAKPTPDEPSPQQPAPRPVQPRVGDSAAGSLKSNVRASHAGTDTQAAPRPAPQPHADAAARPRELSREVNIRQAQPTQASVTQATQGAREIVSARPTNEPRAREAEARREPTTTHEEHAPRLSINRLDVRIIDQTPASPPPSPVPQPAAQVAATRAHASDGWEALDRQYLGRFYL